MQYQNNKIFSFIVINLKIVSLGEIFVTGFGEIEESTGASEGVSLNIHFSQKVNICFFPHYYEKLQSDLSLSFYSLKWAPQNVTI